MTRGGEPRGDLHIEGGQMVKVAELLNRREVYDRVRREVTFSDVYGDQSGLPEDARVDLKSDQRAVMGDEIDTVLGKLLKSVEAELKLNPACVADLVRTAFDLKPETREERAILRETTAAIVEVLIAKLIGKQKEAVE